VVHVSVAVRNSSAVDADEIVQAYVGFPGVVADRPVKLLKAFVRVPLAPGQTQIVDMVIPIADLAWRNPATHSWEIETGRHQIMVGGSSATLLTAAFEV
jgi:beta-glucosidase